MRPQARVGADGGADERIEAEALVERLEVEVDADGGAHPLDPPLGHIPGVGLGAEQDPVGAQLRDADDHRIGAAVQQAVHDPAAEPGDAVKADAARQPERPARTDLAADLQGVAARTACAGRPPSQGAQSPGLAIRWTSTRKLRDPTIGSASSARRGPRLRASLRAV